MFYLLLVAVEIKLAVSLFFSNMFRFYAFSKNCEKRLLASSCLSVRPSICMEQLDSYWPDIHEICYLSIFRKTVEEIQVSVIVDKNTGTLYEDH
jgi:hypothetical protein